MATLSKGAGPQIHGDDQQQHNAENAQRGLVDIPVRGQLHHADGENHPAEENIAQPVGGDA